MPEAVLSVHLRELPTFAHTLLAAAGPHRVWLFKGDLGSGKTTLIKQICAALGVTSPTSSPTFSIINVYPRAAGGSVYHVDCYRLKHAGEALDIGLEEYLSSGNYCLVEWPEKIEPLLPDQAFVVELRKQEPEIRQITYHA